MIILIAFFAFSNLNTPCALQHWIKIEKVEVTVGKTVYHFPWIIAGKLNPIDCRVSSGIARIGYALRFHSGQFLPFIYRAPAKGEINLYVNNETSMQYLSSVDKVKTNLDKIQVFLLKLKAKGIIPVVIAVPTKVSIEREMISNLHPPDLWLPAEQAEEASEAVYSRIRGIDPVSMVNLYKAFSDAQKNKTEFDRVFVPWDYHWSIYGIAIAVKETLKSLNNQGVSVSNIQIKKGDIRSLNMGDAFIVWHQLPAWYVQRQKDFSWKEYEYPVEAHISQKIKGRVFLAGTSFSDRYGQDPFGLPMQLKHVLNVDFYNTTVSGGGVDKSIEKAWSLPKPPVAGDILIWEFPITVLFQEKLELPNI